MCFVAGQNVAIHVADASQRSTYSGYTARFAVDGDINTFSCTFGGSVQDWWSFDLGFLRLVMGFRVVHEPNGNGGKYQYKLINEHRIYAYTFSYY